MPIAISTAKRLSIIEQYEKGKSLLQISKDEKISYATVHRLYHRYKEKGISGLTPHYNRCGSKQLKSSKLIVRAVRCLKTWHPSWGAGRIKTKILQKYPQAQLPSSRTLQRWFRNNGQNKPQSKPPQSARRWAKSVHDVWQIDAKEEVRLANGQKVCWLNITDEKSSAIIDPPVFSLQKDM